jgi:DNA-binding MarR family transcriptional regulator
MTVSSASSNATIESLLATNHRLTRYAAQATGSTVSSAVWSTLSVLVSDGPRRIGDLARDARISQPGMTKIVQNLVTDEWVSRVADVEDSRAWLIVVTDKGRTALAAWRRQLADATGPIFADLSDTEWKVLEHAAQILSERVNRSEAVA